MKDARLGAGILISTIAGFGLVAVAAGQAAYGFTMFLAIPFITGLISVLIYSAGVRRQLRECLLVAQAPFLGIALLLLLLKVEGLICIAMAVPIAIPLGLLGGYVGWLLQFHKARPVIASCLLLGLPPGIAFGPHGPSPHTFVVTTSITIAASPEIVWRYVTQFPAITAPPEALFRAGIAYPIISEIDGGGVGSARRCVLSTGTLDETVTAWNPPYLLRFRVNSTPPAMRELSPWRDIDPPHLHGFYQSKQGEFRLTELPGHRTLLEGTSWYSHGLEPAQYWRIWSDYVVHGVHRRVLEHIKDLAEGDISRRAAR